MEIPADEREGLDTNFCFRRVAGEREKQFEQHVQNGCPSLLFLWFSYRFRSNVAKLQSIYLEIINSLFVIIQEVLTL